MVNNVRTGLQSLCYVHRKSVLHLKINKSTIPNAGDGLFAHNPKSEIVFKKGNKICDYNGEIINRDTLIERYGMNNDDYVIELNHSLYEDGAKVRGIGTIPNHKTNRYTNARLSIKRSNEGQVVATKDIKHDDEIFVNYGRSYKIGGNEISITNKRK